MLSSRRRLRSCWALRAFSTVGTASIASLTAGEGKAWLASSRAEKKAIAYLVDGDNLLLIKGDPTFCTRAFLARIAAGLTGEIRELPAAP